MANFECTITAIKNETHDVRTFRLKPSVQLSFVPGQYALFSFKNHEKRPFTFSSSPTEKGFFEITVKRMGEFTTALHSLKKGDKITVDGPYGEALNFDETVKENVVFLAGGSGITPFISAIRYAVAKKLPNKIVLIFSNRTQGDVIYGKELDRLNKDGKIKVINTLTKETPEGWKGETGAIDKEMIGKYVSNAKEKLWYVCGPPRMTDAMKEILQSMKIEEKRIRIEGWQVPGKND